MNEISLDESVKNKEIFINDILKEDLKYLDMQLQNIHEELSELVRQKHTLNIVTDKNKHPNGFKTQLDLGSNFFMEAAVSDTSKMLINIGLNHFLELSLIEAYDYLDSRIYAFERSAQEIRKKSVEIKAHIKLIMLSMVDSSTNVNKKKS